MRVGLVKCVSLGLALVGLSCASPSPEVATLDGLVRQVCECDALECAQERYEAVRSFAADAGGAEVTPDEARRVRALAQRALSCLSQPVLARIEAVREKACECRDRACAIEVAQTLAGIERDVEGVVLDLLVHEQARKSLETLESCLHSYLEPAAPAKGDAPQPGEEVGSRGSRG